MISAGEAYTCAISNSGKTYCWGYALYGALGDGQTSTNQTTPVFVQDGVATGADTDGTNLINIKMISASGFTHTCAISNSGKTYCWGGAANGRLGDGQSSTTQTTPVFVQDGVATGADTDGTNLINIKMISTGRDHTCAISNSGKTYCWGYAGYGQLGDGQSSTDQTTPVLVQNGVATGADTDGANLINIKMISAGGQHTCALSNSGKTYCWGYDSNGRLGNGASTGGTEQTPVFVQDGVATGADTDGTNLINIKAISAGRAHTCAISNSGKTYCWGKPTDGRLGDGQTTTDQTTPVLVLKGSVTEDQTLTLTGTGNFGGATAWQFYKSIFDGTTTALGAGGTTLESTTTVNGSKILNAGSKTYTLSGSGTPLVITGTFNSDTSTFVYTAATANVTATTFNDLTLGGTGTYTMPGTTITLRGNLLIPVGNTITKGAGTVLFAKGGGGTQIWTDNTASKQDLGTVQISANAGNTTVNLGSSAKFTNVTIDSSQILSANGPNTLTVLGNWTNNGGTFTASTGTVAFSGSGTQTLAGSSAFYNLQMTTAAARTINFTAGTTQSVASGGSVTFTGASGQLLTLASTSPGVEWNLQANNAIAAQTIQYVSVSDSNAGPFSTYAEMIATDGTSTDGGNNTNWDFGTKSSGFLTYF
jgi:alpha-tubulin suppressor-like RCC1 family protein